MFNVYILPVVCIMWKVSLLYTAERTQSRVNSEKID